MVLTACQLYETTIIIIPIMQMKRWMLRKVKELAPLRSTVIKW